MLMQIIDFGVTLVNDASSTFVTLGDAASKLIDAGGGAVDAGLSIASKILGIVGDFI
jgi:hypothetical protein